MAESPTLYLLAQPKQHHKRYLESQCVRRKGHSCPIASRMFVCKVLTWSESGSAKQIAASASLPTPGCGIGLTKENLNV